MTGSSVSDGAVSNQIAWATTSQRTVESGHMQNYFLNISTALECGFLRDSDLPEIILQERIHDINVEIERNLQKTSPN